jgi:PIN domain nuclease of toxin-antitoxin system
MRILFDSHALVWFLDGDSRLSRRALSALNAPDAALVVSAVSAWELANKVRLGKWPEVANFAQLFVETVTAQGYELLAITAHHARLAGFLPGTHRDPFDRMLAAQAQLENIPLVTADPVFTAFGTRVIW